ncbi:retrovirus-related pol polyprotein from transposon TNT 1-94 [Tanacetum coccineum]
MSTQQDIYAAGSENRPPMLNKDNYVPWSSRIIRYAKSRPNGKMIVDSIENGPYVRRMIATPGEPDLPVPVPETFHEQTDEELTENDIKRMDADDQAIQTILLGLPEDVYASVDSCETAKEIWERVRQMMKGLDIGEQEKKAKLFNEWEKFTSTDGESIESYYHRFMQLMNDLKRNKHFPENIAANLKFLNNLQPKWKRHVTIVRQTKNLHEADFTQIYDFLKMNQDEVNKLRAKRLAKTHDPLALMAHSQNPYNFPAPHNDQSSSSTHLQQSFPINNKYNPQPSFNQNFMQPPMTSLEDINDPTEAINAALILFAKAFQLTTPTNNNQRTSSNPRNHQIPQPGMNMGQDRQILNIGGNGGNQFGQYARQVAQNQQGYNAWHNVGNQVAQNTVQNPGVQNGGNQNGLVVVPGIANQNGTGNIVAARAEGTGNGNQVRCYNCRGLGHIARNCTARPRRRDAAYLQTQLLIAQKEEAGIQLQAEEFDFMAAAGDLDEIEELDKAPVYDTDGSAEVQHNDNCYDNDIFNMFTQEEQYTDLLEPIPEPQLVPQNDNNVTSVAPSMVQSGGTVETSFAPNEETRAHQETVYRNLIDQVAQVNMVNRNMRATNAELKSELARYKIQEQRIEISQEKYDKLEKCYQKSVYQEQCLTRKINALHLSSAKQITTLNDEISNLNKQLSKEKSTISSLMEEKKRLKHDFKTREDKYLDKEVDLEAKIKELENILLKRDQTVQTMHMLNPKPDSFYHPDQKMALGYPNPLYLKQAQLKQQSLYNGNLLLEKHDPPAVYDSEETLELAQESREKMRFLKKEIKPVNYAKINHLHLKTTYNNLFDSITSNRANSKLHNLIYENAKLRAQVFEKTSESMNNTSGTSVTPQVDKPKLSVVTPFPKKLHSSIPSYSVPQPKEFNVVKHSNVIATGMFKIDPSQTSRVDLVANNQSSSSIRTNPITNTQHHVTIKEHVSSDMVNSSSTRLVHTARTRRPQPKGSTRNDRVPSASKSSKAKKNVSVEDHRRNLSLSKTKKTMSSECNNIKLAIRNDKSEIVCGTCKQCFVTANHDACLLSFMNALNPRANNLCANVPPSANQKRHRTHVWKPKQVGSKDRLATPKPKLPRFSLKWSPTGSSFNLQGKLVSSNETNCPNVDNACPYNHQEPIRKRFPNSSVFLGRVYFVEGLGHNLFSVGQFCDVDLEVAFRRNTCFIRDLDGVGITHETSAVKTPQQNGVVEHRNPEAISTACYTQNRSIIHRRFNKTLYKLIQGKKLDISYLHVFGALCYLKNDREDISKLDAKGDIGFFIGYSANSVAYRVYNWRIKKIMEMMNVTFDELLAMAFEQNSSKPGLQSLTSG